jgi:hypothetical protein
MTYIVALLNRREKVHFEELRFADEAELECGEGRVISFKCYCNEVVEGASAAQCREDEKEKEYYVTMMRSCFLIALVYDTRVQRFVMAEHDITQKVMSCEPPDPTQANMYMEQILLPIGDFLNRVISIGTMCDYCVKLWSDEYMFRRVGIEGEDGFYALRGGGGYKENIQYTGHPHKLLTPGHTSSYPFLEISNVKDLGF